MNIFGSKVLFTLEDNNNMSTLLDSVDKRTQLAGENRLELLLFHLSGSKQLFGIRLKTFEP